MPSVYVRQTASIRRLPVRSSARPFLTAALLTAARLGAQPAVPSAADSVPRGAAGADSGAAARAPQLLDRPWQIIPFAGYAAHSPLRWGATPDRSHRMLGIQFARPFARAGAVTLAYAPNVVPVFVLTNNPAGAWVSPVAPATDLPATGTGRTGNQPRGRVPVVTAVGCESDRCAPVYGVAVVPLGIRADVAAGRALTVYTAAGMGLVRFARTVPVPQARRTNVTFEGGGGVLVRLPAGPALQLGYKYHHLSNAFTAERNPGVDGDVLYAGLAWTVRGRPARP